MTLAKQITLAFSFLMTLPFHSFSQAVDERALRGMLSSETTEINTDSKNVILHTTTEFIYHANNQHIKTIEYDISGENNDGKSMALENTSQDIYEYNSSGKISSIIHQSWNSKTNEWENWNKHTYTYNEINQLTVDAYEAVDLAYSSIPISKRKNEKQYRYSYKYDAAGLVIERLYEIGNKSRTEYINFKKEISGYANKIKVSYLEMKYDSASKNWINNLKQTSTFNEKGKPLSFIEQKWEDNAWVNSFEDVFSYNAKGLFILRIHKSIQDGKWMETKKNECFYTAFDSLDYYAEYLNTDAPLTKWKPNKKTKYFYDAGNIEVGYAEYTLLNDTLAVNNISEYKKDSKQYFASKRDCKLSYDENGKASSTSIKMSGVTYEDDGKTLVWTVIEERIADSWDAEEDINLDPGVSIIKTTSVNKEKFNKLVE
ncbi:hypothetical protein BH09BAC5_BH09BAC5_10440 [soil metagenome]